MMPHAIDHSMFAPAPRHSNAVEMIKDAMDSIRSISCPFLVEVYWDASDDEHRPDDIVEIPFELAKAWLLSSQNLDDYDAVDVIGNYLSDEHECLHSGWEKYGSQWLFQVIKNELMFLKY
jgi:hypothetical protein